MILLNISALGTSRENELEVRDDVGLRELLRRDRRRSHSPGVREPAPDGREVRLCRLPQLRPRHRRGDGLDEGGRRFFASVGIDDPAQAIGLSVYFTQKDGTLCYGAWYHLFGSRLDVSFRDGDGIIGRDAAFGDAAIVQMDLYADVPWVLDEPNPYLDE